MLKKSNRLYKLIILKMTFVLVFTNAHTASLNPEGIGEALVFPYYTVNNGLDTLLSVSNSTADTKAIRIRFLEGDNGQEVSSFSVYLGPFDMWTAAVTATPMGARLISSDTSCIFNFSSAKNFSTDVYISDPGSDDTVRLREGHFEIIEMGVVTDPNLSQATFHVNGQPQNCNAIETAWEPGGQWHIDPNDGISAAIGGLMGQAIIVNVQSGTAVSYNPEAIIGFYGAQALLHTEPNSLLPNLASAEPRSSIMDSNTIYASEWPRGIDAITALFMRSNLYNDFSLVESLAAKTETVVTFPTKRFYTQPENGPRLPFSSIFGNKNQGIVRACEALYTYLISQEAKFIDPFACSFGAANTCPSVSEGMALCTTTNVVQFKNSALITPASDSILGSKNLPYLFRESAFDGSIDFLNFQTIVSTEEFASGRFELAFLNFFSDKDNVYSYEGLPVTGFTIQQYTNNNAQPNVLAQYASIFKNKHARAIIPFVR
ncbi:hypothetical protein [Marinicella sp. W31]|uniref:hypothetical protein n=1 Tax=Marinicella sp. W31 TaxID=3023713 RepID=UPI0037572C9E